MIVVNKNETVTGYLTIEDLDGGEVFRFKDDTSIFLCSDDAYIVNVESGESFDVYASGFENRPIERIKCHLIID